jgi:DNA-binding transcriptional regulator LsrR (DeoR family)
MPRPKSPAPSTSEMLQVARLFYKDNKSKKEISGALGPSVDTRKVTNILKHAQEKGVVRIYIYESPETALSEAVQTKYPHLKKVLIAAGGEIKTAKEYAEIEKRWGVIAADYFDELVGNQPRGKRFHVAVAGGKQILEFANSVPDMERDDVYIHVPALVGRGRLPKSSTHIDPIMNASVLWTHCGSLAGHSEYATVSAYLPAQRPGPEGKKIVQTELAKVENNDTIRQVVLAMDEIEVIFGAISIVDAGEHEPALRDKLTINSLLDSQITPRQLQKEGAIGAFSYCFFDKAGVQKPELRFWLTAGHGARKYWGIEFFKKMVQDGKLVVAFGGPFCLPAIKVALEAKIFNVWITDEHTARQIAERG